jgi:tetratricopeptide (TPR) repeat protein
MRLPSRRRWWAAGLAALIGLAGRTASDAHAADEPAPSSVQAPDADSLKAARRLFDEGQIHYSLGEYDQALTAFRRAYELSSAGVLLFNIAQAHRLKGDCRQALEVYRHFVRLEPDSPYRAEAESQIVGLTARCGSAPSLPAAPPGPSAPAGDRAPPSISRPVQAAAPAVPSGARSGKRAAVALLAVGIAAGAAGGGVTWWNDNRYGDWAAEDRRLAGPLPAGVSAEAWSSEQAKNDDLLRSIQRVDKVSGALIGLAAACLLGAAVVAILLDR